MSQNISANNASAIQFTPSKSYFIGIDSDGCVFDSMALKHRECFTPVTIWKWDLQAVSSLARECHEFVNLNSKRRGINRFPSLVGTLELLAARPEAVARGFKLPDLAPLKKWLAEEKQLGNATLKKCAHETGDPILLKTLEWSEAVNARIAEMVYGVPPFPFVREILQRAHETCDMIVVSQTPGEALKREWEENGLEQFVHVICGQEQGSKEEHLRATCVGKYPAERTLMIGDAPGDMKAARAAGTLFYPIIPGREEASWERFYNEGYAKFIAGTFAGEYQAGLIEALESALPERADWE